MKLNADLKLPLRFQKKSGMKIALIGYGKMGKAIEQSIIQQGKHEVVLKISIDNLNDLTVENLKKADVAIEFTSPESAVKNMLLCLKAAVPVVCGSTGWLGKFENVKKEFENNKGAMVFASNFSIGVNLFFAINNYAASLFKKHPQYEVLMSEIHHTEKKDAPSGTAISIKKIIEQHISSQAIPIEALRIENVVGTHNVLFKSAVDEVELIHKAHSRSGFAEGAVLAAEWIADKKGVYEFKDVLGIE